MGQKSSKHRVSPGVLQQKANALQGQAASNREIAHMESVQAHLHGLNGLGSRATGLVNRKSMLIGNKLNAELLRSNSFVNQQRLRAQQTANLKNQLRNIDLAKSESAILMQQAKLKADVQERSIRTKATANIEKVQTNRNINMRTIQALSKAHINKERGNMASIAQKGRQNQALQGLHYKIHSNTQRTQNAVNQKAMQNKQRINSQVIQQQALFAAKNAQVANAAAKKSSANASNAHVQGERAYWDAMKRWAKSKLKRKFKVRKLLKKGKLNNDTKLAVSTGVAGASLAK